MEPSIRSQLIFQLLSTFLFSWTGSSHKSMMKMYKKIVFLGLITFDFFILVVSSHNRHTLSQNVPAPMQENPNTSLQGLCPRVRASFRQNHEYRGRAPCQYLLQAFLLLCHRVRSYQRKRVCPSSGDDSQNMHGYHCTAHTNR